MKGNPQKKTAGLKVVEQFLKSGSKGCKLAKKGKRKSLRKELVMRTYWVEDLENGSNRTGSILQTKRWLIPEVWKKWWRKKKKLSKMRAHCKSKSDEQRGSVRVP